MFRAIRQHPGVFIGGAVTFAIVEHWLMHRGGAGQIRSATSRQG